MGIKQSPDIAQEIMEHTLRGIDDVDVYIDDIITIALDKPELIDRVRESVPLAIHILFRPVCDNEPIQRDWPARDDGDGPGGAPGDGRPAGVPPAPPVRGEERPPAGEDAAVDCFSRVVSRSRRRGSC